MSTEDAIFQQAVAQHQAGQLTQAADLYRQLLVEQPDHAEAHHLLGLVALQQQQPLDAIASLQRAAELAPTTAAIHHLLGATYRQLGRQLDAVASLREAVRLAPDSPQFQHDLANALRNASQWPEAEACDRRAITLAPDYGDALKSLAMMLQTKGKFAEAQQLLERALAVNPQDPGAWFNLAVGHYRQSRWAAAQDCYERSIAINGNDPRAHFHLGRVLQLQNRLPESVASFERSLMTEPEFAEAHYHLGQSLLALGDLARGWHEFEWRIKTQYTGRRAFPQRRWQGQPLAGEVVLIHTEGGLGDTLQFLRYVPLVEQLGARIALAVQPALFPLLRESGFDTLLGLDSPELPPCGWQVPLLSLPFVFGTTIATIPATIPYLRAAPRLVESWRGRLPSADHLRVGIHWRGHARTFEDKRRAIPLREFARLVQPGVALISLQKDGQTDVESLDQPFSIAGFGPDLDTTHGALMDTSAIMKNLDLVVTCDTSLAHLAGALGVPVWVAHSYAAEWRWMAERADSPWYPTMRLFRQPAEGDWSSVFECMAGELRQWAANLQATRRRGQLR